MLSIRPKQISGESPVGYILRLTHRNGFESLTDWLLHPMAKSITCGRLNHNNMRFFERMTGRTIHNPQCPFEGNISPLLVIPLFVQPRLCPLCVQSTGYHQQSWQRLKYLYCRKHNCILEGTCKHCGSHLTWHKALLSNRCTNPDCIARIAPREAPPFLKRLSIDRILDCLLADFFYMYPDATLLPKTKYPKTTHLISRVISGYKLLTDRVVAQAWIHSQTSVNKERANYPKSLRNFSVEIFLKYLNANWPITSALKSINKNEQISIDTFPPLTIFGKFAAQTMEINLTQLKQVISLLDPNYNQKKKISAVLPIDMKKLIETLALRGTTIRHPVTLNEVINAGNNDLCTLYQAIYSGGLKFDYEPRDTVTSSIFVDREEI